MGKMKQHFMDTIGENLSPNDIAERVYRLGWNTALDEAIKEMEKMPFGDDTLASFVVYLRNMKDPIP
jgi:hypothetical protein